MIGCDGTGAGTVPDPRRMGGGRGGGIKVRGTGCEAGVCPPYCLVCRGGGLVNVHRTLQRGVGI